MMEPWIVSLDSLSTSGENAKAVAKNISTLSATFRLRMATATYIATQVVSQNDKVEVLKLFKNYDKSGKGMLAKDHLSRAFQEYFGYIMSDQEMDEMLMKLDSEGNGMIEYNEFVIAALNDKKLLSKFSLKNTFKDFDVEKMNRISTKEMRASLDFGTDLGPEVVYEVV
mmetsp:Transcript_7067/g.11902  ORF Transcript_7067/g.11902 Transcript_7067/m.11902 type:complete len:169 (-) Transcript_7067:927-1433(-)